MSEASFGDVSQSLLLVSTPSWFYITVPKSAIQLIPITTEQLVCVPERMDQHTPPKKKLCQKRVSNRQQDFPLLDWEKCGDWRCSPDDTDYTFQVLDISEHK